MEEDDDSSGSEFVPEPDVEDDEEKHKSKKRKENEPTEADQLAPEELDSLWAEMNSATATAVEVAAPRKVEARVVSAPKNVDVTALLSELKSAEKPAMKTETVSFAGVDVQVAVKEKKTKNNARPDNVQNLLDQLKGYVLTCLIGVLWFDSCVSRKPKRINTIEKSEIDWEAHKADNVEVGEEVEASEAILSVFVFLTMSNFFFLQKHMRSGTYLEKISFLKRAELHEYERERDARVNSRKGI